MKRFLPLLFALTAAFASRAGTIVDCNADWLFQKSDVAGAQNVSFDDSRWDRVQLPHTWNALDGQDGGGNYYRGACWYRKTLVLKDDWAGKVVYLRFGAANMQTSAYVNGTLVGTHTGGYAAFMFDITKAMLPGRKNVIAVRVDNSADIVSPPLTADFTFFGGLTRGVQLVVDNPIHISPIETISNRFVKTPIQVASPGVIIKQHDVSRKSAKLDISTKLRNTTDNSTVSELTISVEDAQGFTVEKTTVSKTLAAHCIDTVSGHLYVKKPHLWDGLADPYLYRVEVGLTVGGKTVDKCIQPLGFHFFAVDKTKGFLLNGRSYPLRGMCMHEAKKDKGRAVDDADRREDIDLLAATGMNFFRLAHYQHGDFTYNYLDTLGIICWTEVPCVNKVGPTATEAVYQQNATSQMYELLHQQYNHPSVIFWGLCNEIHNESGADPAPVVQHLNDIVKSEDPSRLTTLAAAGDHKENQIPDVYSMNFYRGWYSGMIADIGGQLDKFDKKYSHCMGMSEYGAGANTQQHEWPATPHPAAGHFHPEEYQNLFHESYLQAIDKRPYLWQTSLWVGIDFAADNRNEGAQPGMNDKGLVSYDRKTKKDAYFLYKASWNHAEPTLYITSRRFTERHSLRLPVKIYSSASDVTLTINGKTMGTKSCPNHIFEWTDLTMAEGKNFIVATATENGKMLRDSVCWLCSATPLAEFPPVQDGKIKVDFCKTNSKPEPGYMKDDGSKYGERGNGYSYGWDVDNTANGRERGVAADKRFDTFVQMQPLSEKTSHSWSIALPKGTYKVTVGVGDPSYNDSHYVIDAGGVELINYYPCQSKYGVATGIVQVTDGRLTLSPSGTGSNTKICFVHISPTDSDRM